MAARLKNFADRVRDITNPSDPLVIARNQVHRERTATTKPGRRPSIRSHQKDPPESPERQRPPRPSPRDPLETRCTLDDIMYATSEASLLQLQPSQLVPALLKLREVAATLEDAATAKERSESRSSHLSQVNQQLASLQAQIDETSETLAAVEAELKQEKAKAKEAARSRNRMLKELSLATKVEATIYDDSHFKEKVAELRYQVYNWVNNRNWKISTHYNTRYPTISKIYTILRHTSLRYAEYIVTESGIRTLIEAHIWQYLGREVFSRSVWADTSEGMPRHENDLVDNAFTRLRTDMRRDVPPQYEEKLQAWRVASARLMALRPARLTEKSIASATRRVYNPLSEELDLLITGERNSRGLEKILKNAVILDSLIQQQRPEYMFYPILDRKAQYWFVKYDKATMELGYDTPDGIFEESELKVQLVLQPGFWKCGDSSGNNFETRMCLLKTEVEVEAEVEERGLGKEEGYLKVG
ncbi:hypothetical protein VTL71DRAFT_9682 [Oculimacula yallundae]|uniref:Uncharacterized protein n=1 Tax=Oculimacula yallundae TaxID=86028 RepID=A0ABR4BSD8_9HELO